MFNDKANHSVAYFTRAQLQPAINVATEVNKPRMFVENAKQLKVIFESSFFHNYPIAVRANICFAL